ncbi:MAG: RNA recognition motif domain-containing protein, partial [Thermodesulfobacteriota bacterium]
MNIYVGNLSYEATDGTIREAFESFGEVTSARVIKDKYNGQSRGFGFVEMPAQSQAQTAIRSLTRVRLAPIQTACCATPMSRSTAPRKAAAM